MILYFPHIPRPKKVEGMAEEKKDKAENELGLASDCGWIRGLDAAGKPIRISKADMVELIRANMPVATSERNGLLGGLQLNDIANSLKGKGGVNGSNIEGLRESGIYSVTSVIPSSGNMWGILVVCNSNYYILQLIFGASGAAYRHAHGPALAWSAWVTL